MPTSHTAEHVLVTARRYSPNSLRQKSWALHGQMPRGKEAVIRTWIGWDRAQKLVAHGTWSSPTITINLQIRTITSPGENDSGGRWIMCHCFLLGSLPSPNPTLPRLLAPNCYVFPSSELTTLFLYPHVQLRAQENDLALRIMYWS